MQGTCTARIPGYGGQIDVNISYVAEEAPMDIIRLIASDLDATLLDGQSQLPPDSRRPSAHWRSRASGSLPPADGLSIP